MLEPDVHDPGIGHPRVCDMAIPSHWPVRIQCNICIVYYINVLQSNYVINQSTTNP